MKPPRIRLTYSGVVSTLALTFALGMGGAYAADKLIDTDDIEKNAITSKLIDNGQVKSKDLKDNKGVKGIDVAESSLDGTDIIDAGIALADLGSDSVDSTKVVNGSLANGDLVAEERFRYVGAAGEPVFNNGGQGDCVWGNITDLPGYDGLPPAGFRLDRSGDVHLTGAIVAAEVVGAGDEECGATVPPDAVDDTPEDVRAFTLPAGYAPPNSLILADAGGNQLIIAGTAPFVVSGTDQGLVPGGVYVGDPPSGAFLDGFTYTPAGSSLVSGKAPGAGDLGVASDAEPEILDGLLGR